MIRWWKMFVLRWEIADLCAEADFWSGVATPDGDLQYVLALSKLRNARARLALLEDPAKVLQVIINRRALR